VTRPFHFLLVFGFFQVNRLPELHFCGQDYQRAWRDEVEKAVGSRRAQIAAQRRLPLESLLSSRTIR